MLQSAIFLIPGQDARSRYAAQALEARGCKVADCPVAQADVIVLPMGVRVPPELLSELRPEQYVLGGRLGADHARLTECGVRAIDYYKDPLLQYANAVPTAEGAIQLLMEHLPITLQDSCGLVVGYGRIGAVLCKKLALLGAQITASARNDDDLGRILAAGLRVERTGQYQYPLCNYHYIVNTVPAPILSEQDYGALRHDCLLLELASDPGGFDAAQCRAHQIHCVRAPGLPGRCAPKSAGYAIADAVIRCLKLEESS